MGRHLQRNGQPPLKKARSANPPSLPRLQSLQNRKIERRTADSGCDSPISGEPKKVKYGLGIERPATDSDKENWTPERQFSARRRDQGDTDLARRNGVEQDKASQHTRTRRPSLDIGDRCEDPEEDEDVADFMQAGKSSKSNSVSEEEELDCVQGLLSLSQGNWK